MATKETVLGKWKTTDLAGSEALWTVISLNDDMKPKWSTTFPYEGPTILRVVDEKGAQVAIAWHTVDLSSSKPRPAVGLSVRWMTGIKDVVLLEKHCVSEEFRTESSVLPHSVFTMPAFKWFITEKTGKTLADVR